MENITQDKINEFSVLVAQDITDKIAAGDPTMVYTLNDSELTGLVIDLNAISAVTNTETVAIVFNDCTFTDCTFKNLYGSPSASIRFNRCEFIGTNHNKILNSSPKFIEIKESKGYMLFTEDADKDPSKNIDSIHIVRCNEFSFKLDNLSTYNQIIVTDSGSIEIEVDQTTPIATDPTKSISFSNIYSDSILTLHGGEYDIWYLGNKPNNVTITNNNATVTEKQI